MVYISNLPGFVQQVYFVSFSQTGEIQPLHPVPYSSFSTDSEVQSHTASSTPSGTGAGSLDPAVSYGPSAAVWWLDDRLPSV